MRTYARIAMLAALATGALAGCSGDSATTSSTAAVLSTGVASNEAERTSTTPPMTTGQPQTDSSSSASESGFWCAGSRAPWVFAVNMATGQLAWTVCKATLAPAWVVGRASGVTLLWQQDGHGNAVTVALDDTGAERWHHASDANNPQLILGEHTVVSVLSQVEAINVTDGAIRWSHPLADATPIAVGHGLVVEITGGPYVAPSTPSNAVPAVPAVEATLRALDELSGEQRWTTPIMVAPLPPPNQYSPTVGNSVIAVPIPGSGTDIVEFATGTPIRQEHGQVIATGDWLVRIEPSSFAVQAVAHADTGEILAGVTGQPFHWPTSDAEHALPVDDLLTVRATSSNRQAFDMIDTATGSTRWTLDNGYPIAQSGDGVLVTDDTDGTLRLLDRRTGITRWKYPSPANNIGFMSAAFGDSLVVVIPGYLGD